MEKSALIFFSFCSPRFFLPVRFRADTANDEGLDLLDRFPALVCHPSPHDRHAPINEEIHHIDLLLFGNAETIQDRKQHILIDVLYMFLRVERGRIFKGCLIQGLVCL